MTALIVGGHGAVGARIVTGLRANGHHVLTAGRDPERADRVVDLTEPDTLVRAIADVGVVVNASGVEDPRIAMMAATAGAAFVDITATTSYMAALEQMSPPAPLLLSVGLAPGLTNLLAVAAFENAPGPIDLAVLLGAGDEHGMAATDWSLRLLGRRFPDPGGDGMIRNYTHPAIFELPGYGRFRLYRADFSDQHTLSGHLGIPVRSYFGLDSRLATTALAALTWVPGASRLLAGIPLPGSDRWLALARRHDGVAWWADGRGQSQATAIMTTLAVEMVMRLDPGVHHLHEVMKMEDVPLGRGIDIHIPGRR